MVEIPEGAYGSPAGVLLVKASDKYTAIVRWMPTDREVPEAVDSLDFYWLGKDFDGTQVGFGEKGITDSQLDALPPQYRYREVIDD